jgi:hypothetical protein
MRQCFNRMRFSERMLAELAIVAVAVVALIYAIYSPLWTAGDFKLPPTSQWKQATGSIRGTGNIGTPYLLMATHQPLALHCEPDPPIDNCLDHLSLDVGKPVTVIYSPSTFKNGATPAGLLISMSQANKTLISAEETSTRINRTVLYCSRTGIACRRDFKKFGASQSLFALFIGVSLFGYLLSFLGRLAAGEQAKR